MRKAFLRSCKKISLREVSFFYFSSSERSFLKYEKNMRLKSSISGYIRSFLTLELGSSISRKRTFFFGGGRGGLDQVAPYYTTALASVTHERGPNLTMEG